MRTLIKIPKSLTTAFLLFLGFSFAEKASSLTDISDLLWKNRVIIITQPNNFAFDISILKNAKHEFDEREIIWFLIKDASVESNYSDDISNDFKLNISKAFQALEFEIILFGKDGSIKLRRNDLNLNEIFSTVDAMPMRIREIENKGKH